MKPRLVIAGVPRRTPLVGPGWLGIVGDGVSVDYDVGSAERFFCLSAGDVEWAEVNEGHVVVGAARDEAEAALSECVRKRDGVGSYLSLVMDELFGHRFAEGDCLGGYGVFHRAALGVGEDGAVDGAGVVGVGEYHASAWTSEGLVSGGGDYLGLTHGRGMLSGGNESGNVGHIHH